MKLLGRLRQHRHRWLSLLLVVVLFATTTLTGLGMASRVTIPTEFQSGNPAHDYLIANTDYVQADRLKRMGEYARTMRAQDSLADYYKLAGIQIGQEKYKEAIDSLNKCIELYDGENDELYIDLWLKKGCLHMLLEELQLALDSLNRVTAIDESIAEAFLIKAQIYAKQNNVPKMTEALNSYIDLSPEDTDLLSLLSELRRLQGETKQIGDGSLASLLPANGGPQTADSAFLTGLFAIQEGNYAKAETALSNALAMNPSNGDIYYYRGVSRLVLEKYSGAIEDFTASIGKGITVQGSYYNRGIARILTNDYEAGIKDIQYAAEKADDLSVKNQAEAFLAQISAGGDDYELAGLLFKAEASGEQKDMEGMCRYLDEYLAKAPEDREIRKVLAQARFANEEYDKALEQYGILLEGEADGDLEYMYGLCALQLSDFILAEAALSRAVAANCSANSVYYYRGICRLSLANYKEATSDFDTAIEKGSMVHSSYFNRGISLLMDGKTKKGLEDVKYAANSDEDIEIQEQAKQLLLELEKEGVRP